MGLAASHFDKTTGHDCIRSQEEFCTLAGVPSVKLGYVRLWRLPCILSGARIAPEPQKLKNITQFSLVILVALGGGRQSRRTVRARSLPPSGGAFAEFHDPIAFWWCALAPAGQNEDLLRQVRGYGTLRQPSRIGCYQPRLWSHSPSSRTLNFFGKTILVVHRKFRFFFLPNHSGSEWLVICMFKLVV